MVKIRSLGQRELKQTLGLLSAYGQDVKAMQSLRRLQSLYLPFHKLNHFLPLRFKFLPEIFVAQESGQVVSVVWMSADGKRKDCWKIDEIVVNPEAHSSISVTQQLVQFGISQLGAKGVETFLAYVDNHAQDAIALFKQCGFRRATAQIEWQKELTPEFVEGLGKVEPNELGLQQGLGCPKNYLHELYMDSLPQEVRISLRKDPSELHPGFNSQLFSAGFYKSWVLLHHTGQYLMGYLSISSSDYKKYHIQLLVSRGIEDQLGQWLKCALGQVSLSSKYASVSLTVFEFQKSHQSVLEEQGFERLSQTEILVKDHWLSLQSPTEKATSPILFLGQRPAAT